VETECRLGSQVAIRVVALVVAVASERLRAGVGMDDTREQDEAGSASDWRDGERDLRVKEVDLHEKEVKRQIPGMVLQAFLALAAIIGASVAAFAAVKAGDAVDVAKEGVQSNADENRLSTAVDALGGETPSQRVAGLTLLRRLASQRVENATEADASEAERRDALRMYRSTVDILATYLKTPNAPSSPLGIGDPLLPPDFPYAQADLVRWLRDEQTVLTLMKGHRDELPSVDLARAWLYGVSWPNADFSWLDSRFLPGVDLRRANLSNSTWGNPTTFTEAYLGCANFSGAKLKDAILTDADAHSANLQDANLRAAKFDGANLTGADFTDADLRGAILTNANVRGADLTNADLREADLTDADFTGAKLDGARIDDGALNLTREQPQPPPDSAALSDPACPAPTN
jgi:Pentapeptide repeats (8 copies)